MGRLFYTYYKIKLHKTTEREYCHGGSQQKKNVCKTNAVEKKN